MGCENSDSCDCGNSEIDMDDPDIQQLLKYHRYYVSVLGMIEKEIVSENPKLEGIEYIGNLNLKETSDNFGDVMEEMEYHLVN